MIISAGTVEQAKVDGKDLSRSARPVIQNLGAGDLYLGSQFTKDIAIHTAYATPALAMKGEGLKLTPGCVYEVPAALIAGLSELWWYADGTCDVRILIVG
jgi:hypothetical protein